MPNLPTFKRWPAGLRARNTRELIKLYESGFQGAVKDPAAEEKLYSSLEYKTFSDAAHENEMAEDGTGKLNLAYEPLLALNPLELPGPAQQTGCCVSRATVNAFSVSYAWEVYNGIPDDQRKSKKKFAAAIAERWPKTKHPDQQTFDHTIIYGERTWRTQGANCNTLAEAARDLVGLVPRGVYDVKGYGEYDCETYDDNKAARSGPRWPDALRKFANEYHVRDLAYIDTYEETRDANANGYGVQFCSSHGVRSRRPRVTDDHGNECAGPNEWSGSWAHAQTAIASDDRPEVIKKFGYPLVLICNSWGEWNSGPTRIYNTDKHIPAGCYWVTSKTWEQLIGTAIIISNIKGFPRRPLIVSFW